MASFEMLSAEASTKLPDSELASQAEENDSDMETIFFKVKQVEWTNIRCFATCFQFVPCTFQEGSMFPFTITGCKHLPPGKCLPPAIVNLKVGQALGSRTWTHCPVSR